LAARYRDRNAQVGNLLPGQPLFAERIVATIPMNPWSWAELIALHRTRNSFRDAATPFRSPPFKTRSLRRFS
jgi:hypothetical protein